MRRIAWVSAIFLGLAGAATAEPFEEVTIGLPVPALSEAEAWYASFLGPDVEFIHPVPGIVEFKIAPGVWLQLFETADQEAASSVVRFSVTDFEAAQSARAGVGIETGEAVIVPDAVTFSEFSDPYGNALGLYSVP
ncbi:MAG: VOC family protein [Devosia sp.]